MFIAFGDRCTWCGHAQVGLFGARMLSFPEYTEIKISRTGERGHKWGSWTHNALEPGLHQFASRLTLDRRMSLHWDLRTL